MARTLRDAVSYHAVDGYSRPRRKHHRSRYESSSSAYMDEPQVERLRRARTEYYSVPAEGQRQRELGRRMAQEKMVPRRRATTTASTVKSSGRRHSTREHRRSRYADDEPRRSSRREEPEDDDGYVYTTVIKDKHGGSRRTSRQELGASRTTLGRSSRDGKTLSRAGTSRRSRVLSPGTERTSRYDDRDGRDPAASSQSLDRAARPKVKRTTSLQSSRPMMTRPSIKRTNTIKLKEDIDALRAPTTGSISPSKERRKSTGLLGLFRHVSPPSNTPEKLVSCLICLSDTVPLSRSAQLSCTHRMCHACLKRLFTLSVTDPQHMPPTCCTTSPIPLKHVDRLFSTKFKILWNKKYREYTTANRVYCPAPGCGEWIKPEHISTPTTPPTATASGAASGRQMAKCTRCKTRVCVSCNARWHGSATDCPNDAETVRLTEIAKREGWQRCYNCRAMVELKEGCNHMTCRCKAQFCMLCGDRWKTCQCPWFNYADVEEGDRLREMRVPEYEYVVTRNGRRVGGDADDAGVETRQMHALYNEARARLARQRQRDRQREREEADEALARRLQRELALEEVEEPEIEVEVYAVGNAGRHHLNESYRVGPTRPIGRSQTVRERGSARSGGAGGGGGGGGDVSSRAGRRGGSGPVEASVMAGLSADGGGSIGQGRVGTWLMHVEDDPAEVEGRRAARAGEVY